MDGFTIFILLILLFVFVGIPMLFFFLGKALQSKKTGVILAIVTFLLLISPIVYLMNKDLFFTKNDAQEILAKNKIILDDDFEFVEKEIEFGSKIFTLKISEKDHQKIWNQFQIRKDSVDVILKEYPKSFKSYGIDEDGDLYFDGTNEETYILMQTIGIKQDKNEITYTKIED